MRSRFPALPRLGAVLVTAVLVSGVQAAPVGALDLAFPGAAVQTASRSAARTSFRLPIGPFAEGKMPKALTEGAMEQVAYRVALTTASTLDLMQPLRDQLVSAGFEVLFECEAMACGGYDFRYGTDVLPEPDMHVDLGDFRYLAARRGQAEVVSLMVSRAGLNGFVQVTQVGGAVRLTSAGKAATPAKLAAKAVDKPVATPAVGGTLVQGLEQGRALALDDLVFASGSAALVEGDYPTLSELGAWLQTDARRVVTLVGHTDASGGLEGNIRLSKLRAESVRQNLLSRSKIAAEQVQAEGVGYLAPRASNLTEEGRRQNRRVEVMMTSTELLAP